MKRILAFCAAALAAAATTQAGPSTNYGISSMDRPGSESGRGFYLGVQGGLNAYQDTDSAKIDGVKFSSQSNVGGFGGLKFGYVSGSALDVVRPALELDGFYNGCSQDVTASMHGFRDIHGTTDMDSGAFLANGIVRFALGSVQPYIGAGAGFYTAGYTEKLAGLEDSWNRTDFAWQLLAGVDCYVASNISIFTEYKFLNYVENHDRTGQQLVGAGVRFHF